MWVHIDKFSEVEKVLNQTDSPRLQVVGQFDIDENTGEKIQVWNYEMVYEHFTEGIVKLPINKQTRYGGGINEYRDKDGKIEPTMRISADSKWDAIKWNMTIFFIFENEVERVNLDRFKEIFKDRL